MGNLIFKKLGPAEAAVGISRQLMKYLGKGRVLLSLSGGSAIETEMIILRGLPDLHNLAITLNDERYGPGIHKDSNWHQMQAAGLDMINVNKYPVLKGEPPEQTTANFETFLESSGHEFDYRLSILGMGPDGHTSGILPLSPAASSDRLACYYEGPDYRRITNTFNFLRLQDEVFVLAYGAAKHQQIAKLDQVIPLKDQPVQIIKAISAVTFYNDFKGVDK